MKLKLLLIALVVAVAGALLAAVVLLSGPSYRRTDVMLAGDSLRVGERFATLVIVPRPFEFFSGRSERYNMGVDLVLHDVKDLRRRDVIEMTERGKDMDLRNNAKLLGYDGKRLWLFSHAVFGVEIESKRRVGVEELAQANPELGGLWLREAKFYKMDEGRLVATVGDGRMFSFAPESLKAEAYREAGTPKPAKDMAEYRRQVEIYNRKMAMFGVGPGRFFFTGEKLGEADWIGLLTEEQAAEAGEFWSSPRAVILDGKRRRLYRSRGGEKVALGADSYLEAGLLRAEREAKALRLSNPEGYLVMHRWRLGQDATLMLTRVEMDGKKLWEFDTGIHKVDQVLPGERYLGLMAEPAKLYSVELGSGTIQEAILP